MYIYIFNTFKVALIIHIKFNKMKKRLLILCFCIIYVISLQATNYYVSPNGNDNNDGLSPGTAFRTLSKINSLSFLPGDVIALEGGEVFTGKIEIDDDGTAANPITLTSYNGGIATVQSLTNTIAVTIESSHFVVSDLKIQGVYVASTDGSEADVPTNAGLAFEAINKNINNITINNIEASKFEWFGIKVKAAIGFTIDGVNILNCHVHNNGFVGINTDGGLNTGVQNIKNVLVENCVVHHNKGWSASAAGSAILLSNVENGILQYCTAHHNGGNNSGVGHGGGGGIWSTESKNVIFQYNESHHNETGNADGNAFNFDGGSQNCIMQYNYSHDNAGGGFILFQYGILETKNITIRYNISENDGLFLKQGAIHAQINTNVTRHLKDVFIYNNTIFNDNPNIAMVEVHDVAPPVSQYDIQNVHIYNNVFIQPNGGIDIEYINQGTATVGNNYRDPIDGNAMIANPGNSGTVGNADFFDHLADYQVLANSPLIDAGWNLNNLNIPNFGNMGAQDLFGNAIPNNGAYDIGANEFAGACVPSELLISNTFDDINSPDVPDWNFSTSGTAIATATINQWDNAVINISNPGAFDYNVQLRQDNFGMTAGNFYVLNIHARADANRNINFKLRNRLDGTSYISSSLTLSNTFQEYVVVFQAPVTDNDLRLVLLFGADTNDVYLEDVSFQAYCGEPTETQIDCLEYLYLNDYSISTNTFNAAINLQSNATIIGGETVIFKAGQLIELPAGFSIEPNANFEALIDTCN